jgi:hypothetical protein
MQISPLLHPPVNAYKFTNIAYILRYRFGLYHILLPQKAAAQEKDIEIQKVPE